MIYFNRYFLPAVGLFALVHILYTTTFGFRPLKMKLGFVYFSLMAVISYFIIPLIQDAELKIILPLYSVLLLTMAWRAMAKVNLNSIRLPQLLAGLGK